MKNRKRQGSLTGQARKPLSFPVVSVDTVVFSIRSGVLNVLLIRRGCPPYLGMWALPGGLVKRNEFLEHAAARELKEESGIACDYLEQLYTFGDPGRDPRGRVFTVSYFGLLRSQNLALRAGDDAAEARWFPVYHMPRLAFDHRQIVDYALQRLKNKLSYTTMGCEFLPAAFTLTELQRVYEIVFNRKLDKRNFRKKVLSARLLMPTSRTRSDGAHRPARLYALRKGHPLFLEIKLV